MSSDLFDEADEIAELATDRLAWKDSKFFKIFKNIMEQ